MEEMFGPDVVYRPTGTLTVRLKNPRKRGFVKTFAQKTYCEQTWIVGGRIVMRGTRRRLSALLPNAKPLETVAMWLKFDAGA